RSAVVSDVEEVHVFSVRFPDCLNHWRQTLSGKLHDRVFSVTLSSGHGYPLHTLFRQLSDRFFRRRRFFCPHLPVQLHTCATILPSDPERQKAAFICLPS